MEERYKQSTHWLADVHPPNPLPNPNSTFMFLICSEDSNAR